MKLEELTQEKLDELLGRFDALEESNKGLKSDLAKAKAKAKGAEIDPEEHAALKIQVEELTDKAAKTEAMSKKEIEKLTKSLQEKDGALNTYLLDAGLTDALAKSRVMPELMDAAKALLKTQAAIKAENGNYSAVLGDKPLAEAIAEWAKSDKGKPFVAADANNGGGAQGGSNNSNSKTITRAEWDAKSHVDRASMAKDGYKVVD